jgi:flavin reductase (DIM6/NTAB) family NADH-FMN oxidoreductase RutF
MNVESSPYLQLAPAGSTDTGLLRRAFGTFATGVTVITVGGENPHGMTANSFTGVSLRPPLVLVCVDRTALMHERMGQGLFGISVLSAGQEPVARYFADLSRPLGSGQFDVVDHYPGPLTGAPLIQDALAHFECELANAFDGGDHTIFLGRLLALRWREEHPTEETLLFVRGRFRRPGPAGG